MKISMFVYLQCMDFRSARARDDAGCAFFLRIRLIFLNLKIAYDSVGDVGDVAG